MATDTTDISIADICQNIGGENGETITAEVLKLFQDNGLTYKVKDDGSRYRIFCYIKKSKESIILGTMDNRKDFIVQLRITDRTALNKLDNCFLPRMNLLVSLVHLMMTKWAYRG